jgi:ubiquitin-like modifier-activating enzyme ATG7
MSEQSVERIALRFAPFASQISPSFWTALAAMKIDKMQLSDETLPDVSAWYTVGNTVLDRSTNERIGLPAHLGFEASSLPTDSDSPSAAESSTNQRRVKVQGVIKNFNTIEDFKKADKGKLLQECGDGILSAILHDHDPIQRLTTFMLLSFSDLKKYKFYYWFAFPALQAQPAWNVCSSGWRTAIEEVGVEILTHLHTQLQQRQESVQGFFLVDRRKGAIAPVMQYNEFFACVEEADRVVGFIDPSAMPDTPGWPLRNLLTLLTCRFGVRRIGVLCWRQDGGQSAEKSLFVRVEMAEANTASEVIKADGHTLPLTPSSVFDKPSVVGWERNGSGKLAPRLADLGAMMDPKRLADQAVDLNLKLMRWRILPEIDLEKIQSTRCLLLGAGTLGCYVARTLLGWGVRTITLVDSSTVSFSNPVRQPLFTFDDCLEGGKPKAVCAANALRTVYPGVTSRGVQLAIPMPGHPIPATNEDRTQADLRTLEELFDAHDVVYLLMDSRESRWLPTVLGAVKGKLVMNTALGFDTFLAMRHGASPDQHAQTDTSTVANQRLGCYFCNDIVAPTDSLTDRTLDQMCTVTRPGLAAMASACTVEMMVSVLQHPRGLLAPAFKKESDGTSPDSMSILGHLPHQLRGSLFNFQNLLIHGPAYDRCTACSATVIDAYRSQGFEMVKRACNDEAYLRGLTGLDKLYDATDDIEVEWSEEEDDGPGAASEGDGELL